MTNDIYTDGACSGNPGVGGWGVVILINDKNPIYINGGKLNTTNNQMELKAAIEALKYFKNSSSINLFTDSKYVKDGIQLWIQKWKTNGWKTALKKQVKNKDLWIELDEQISKHEIKWHWVKGHSGNKFNEKADELARKFIKKN
tara:strand:- start:227 stop:658 length:432 start_codon:yes stop_codon:yes gene_type:complete